MRPEGILVIDKPAGMTSHDVVDAVRRKFKTKKVGHAGTLDPDATGILVLGLGRATRLLTFTQSAPKRYRARARFGTTTTTQDAAGEVVAQTTPTFDEAELAAALDKFTGAIEQIPPMVSAVKVGGERLYKKARRGEDVKRAPRKVTIFELQPTAIDLDAYEADLDVVCSGGTYIRTLVHDIGEVLGCGAHLASLRRTESGGFGESDAADLERAGASDLRPIDEAVRELPRLDLDASQASAVANGRGLPVAEDLDLGEGQHVAVFASDRLLAVYVRRGDELRAERVLAS